MGEIPEINLPEDYEKDTDEEGKHYVKEIEPETDVKDLKDKVTSDEYFDIVDKDGKTLTDDDKLKTGDRVQFGSGEYYIIVIKGDINGDGDVTLVDLARLKMHLIEVRGKMLQGEYLKAADINNDGKVTITDLAIMKNIIIGLIGKEEI